MKPKRIFLIRHGQSLGNVSRKVYKTTPDHKIPLTSLGTTQAYTAGGKIKKIIGDEEVCYYVSPYKRTRQTACSIERVLQETHKIEDRFHDYKIYKEEPRIREQEWVNPAIDRMFGRDLLKTMYDERDEYGTFFYRIPGGESGADVYDRISTFLETLHRDFEKDDFPKNVIIVTHGLALRLFLMRWFHWTVEEYEDLLNPKNCQVVLMEKDDNGKYELISEIKRKSDKISDKILEGEN